MSLIQQGLEKLQHFSLAPTASRSAALDGSSVDLKDYDGDVLLILDVAAGGTSTCTVTLQDSADNVTFANVSAEFTRDGVLQAAGTVAFSQVGTAASKQTIAFNKDGIRRYVKAVSAEAGTHVYSVNGIGVKKYG
jgi:hypothetical protein